MGWLKPTISPSQRALAPTRSLAIPSGPQGPHLCKALPTLAPVFKTDTRGITCLNFVAQVVLFSCSNPIPISLPTTPFLKT